jgi:CheY-like chemotaxis protein
MESPGRRKRFHTREVDIMSIALPTEVAPLRVLAAWSPAERREDLLDILEASSCEVTEVGDGFELLDVLTTTCPWYPQPESSFDLVVASSRLQGYSAIEVLEEMRRAVRRVPFLILVAEQIPHRLRILAGRLGVVAGDDPAIVSSCVEWLQTDRRLPARQG